MNAQTANQPSTETAGQPLHLSRVLSASLTTVQLATLTTPKAVDQNYSQAAAPLVRLKFILLWHNLSQNEQSGPPHTKSRRDTVSSSPFPPSRDSLLHLSLRRRDPPPTLSRAPSRSFRPPFSCSSALCKKGKPVRIVQPHCVVFSQAQTG